VYYAVNNSQLTMYYTVVDARAIATINPRGGNTGVELTNLAISSLHSLSIDHLWSSGML